VTHLAELLRERGSKRFLHGALLEPTSTFFPDAWRGDAESVERLLGRVLRHAGLGELSFELEIYESGEPDESSGLHLEGVHHVGEAAAWFAGLDDDSTAHFGVARDNLRDPEGLAGILCHEAAHAFRARHGLTYFDHAEDELLTDLTTVFLGFGVLTANLTHRYRTRAEGNTRSMGGYLSPVAMSFALAAQVVARGVESADAKKLATHLEAAQEGCFLESFRFLAASRDQLLGELGLERARVRTRPNEGQPVYRIKPGWLRSSRCSGLDCGARLGSTEKVCSSCGGEIRGDVRTQAEAAAAESALADAAGGALLAKLDLGKRPR
jgi:hypothetical protein